MHEIFRATLAAVLLAAGVASSAQAANASRGDAGQRLRERIAAADTDHDGYLSRDEAAKGMPKLAAHFDEIDTDHDGKLSTPEIAAYLKKLRAARNADAD
ncbi:MAG TPA: EF-hand domain-containing protein [Rudaea sp.]|nr:EF-hand domain-containing protein [Rudaea sp.]